jgi:site-specific recombinase XerD
VQPDAKPRPLAAEVAARQRQGRVLRQAIKEEGRAAVAADTGAPGALLRTQRKVVHRGPRQAQKIVKRVAERARISQNVTPHVLRHTFATTAIQKRISLAAIQKILGHDRLGTTAIYLNLTDTHVVDEHSQKW